jgi:hypothetical protein
MSPPPAFHLCEADPWPLHHSHCKPLGSCYTQPINSPAFTPLALSALISEVHHVLPDSFALNDFATR